MLLGVVRDQLLQIAGLPREGDLGVPPRLQEPLLASDHEPALASLQVDHQPLEPVGNDQHLLGFLGTVFGGAQICDRGQQHCERSRDNQRKQPTRDHHATCQPASHRRLRYTVLIVDSLVHDDGGEGCQPPRMGMVIAKDMTGLRVVLADDDVLLREGLASLLERSGFEIVGQAGDSAQLLALVRDKMPALVVVDIRMPPTHIAEGLEAARQIRQEQPETGIVVLSAHVEVEYAMELLASGRGIGYLLKSRVTDVEEFIETLERIAKGGVGGRSGAGRRAGRGPPPR